MDALSNSSISRIVLAGDVTLGGEPDNGAVRVRRNVSVVSAAPGSAMPALDFAFRQRGAVLEPGVTVTFNNVLLRNMRKGSGAGIDFFAGMANSSVHLDNVQRWRFVCANASSGIAAARSYPRSPGHPGNQTVALASSCVRGTCYPDSILFIDFAAHINLDSSESSEYMPGYDIILHNSTRLCNEYVPPSCTARQTADQCQVDIIDAWLAAQALAARANPDARAAAIAAGVSAGVAVLIFAAGGALWCRRRERLRERKQRDEEAGAGLDSGHMLGSTKGGWRVVARHGVGGGTGERVQLGALLGAGSFGRVYKGRWQGRDVAVKVLQHDLRCAARVANEASLIMSFEHANVLHAYDCITWARGARAPHGGNAGGGGRSTHGSAATHSGQVRYRSSSTLGPEPPASGVCTCPRPAAAGEDSAEAVGGATPLRGAQAAAGRGTAGAAGNDEAGAGAAAGGRLSPSLQQPSSQQQQQQQQQQSAAQERGAGRRPVGPARGRHSGLEDSGFVRDLDSGGAAATSSGAHLAAAAAPAPELPHDARAWDGSASSPLPPLPPAGELSYVPMAAALPAPPPLAAGAGVASGAAPLGSGGAPASSAHPASQQQGATASGPLSNAPSSGLVRQAALLGSSAAAPGDAPAGGADGSRAEWLAANSSKGSGGGAAEAQTWLLLEYCDQGTLADASQEGRLRLPDGTPHMAQILMRLHETAAGMAYLHSRSVLHGDLKAANVLLSSSPAAPFGAAAKVSDFGLSRALGPSQTHASTGAFGTLTHQPPEVLRTGRMSAAGDVYSFAILMWELYSGSPAFEGMHYGEVFERVAVHGERPPLPPGMPEPYALLMTSCWAADPSERPGFESVVRCLQIMLVEALQQGGGAPAAAPAAGAGTAGGAAGGTGSGAAAASGPGVASSSFFQDL